MLDEHRFLISYYDPLKERGLGTQDMEHLLEQLAKKITKLAKTTVQQVGKVESVLQGAAKTVKKVRAGFDQLEIMGKTTTKKTGVKVETPDMTILEFFENIGQQITGLAKPLIQDALGKTLWSVEEFSHSLRQVFSKLNDDTLNPIWVGTLSRFRALRNEFIQVWSAAEEGTRRTAAVFDSVRQAMGLAADAAAGETQSLEQSFQRTAAAAQGTLGQILPAVDGVNARMQGAFAGLRAAGDGVLSSLKRVAEYFNDGFQMAWKQGWQGLDGSVESGVNGIIDKFNGLLTGVGTGLSSLFSRSGSAKTVTVPKIPALATGAVLPANAPFLALVGDQKHGTNIEAPLATIQEAVAAVAADQTGAILAGFEASVAVQKQILEAVLGIRIGDDVIAAACSRFDRKMAVVRGG